MTLFLTILLLAIGIVLIIKGGDVFVDAASWIAEVSGIPKLIVGATVVSFATTLPELLVSVMAAAEGKVDMAIGNAIGSVTANIALIMAIGIICIPSAIRRKDYLLKSILMIGAAVFIVVTGYQGEVGLVPGLLLFVIFAVAMFDNVRAAVAAVREKNGTEDAPDPTMKSRRNIIINILKFVFGAAAIVIGARLLVDNGSELARLCGVSERIISVTIMAVGTSLPELVTTITAVVKKQASLSVGNIIGANIIDTALILPICSLVSGSALTVTEQVARVDLPACLIVGCVAMVPALISKKFRRLQGVILLALYVVYLVITCVVIK